MKNKRLFKKEEVKAYALITIGAFIEALGFVLFIDPHKIVPGGVYGVGIIMHYISEGWFSWCPDGLPIGAVGLVLNIPLTIIGIKILGPKFGVKTVVGFILASVFIDLQTKFFGYEPLIQDMLLSSIYGAVFIGIGLGLIFKTKATSGGSDIIAMILEKYTGFPLGRLLMLVDSTIVLLSLVTFKDWSIPLYSWLVIFITGIVIDRTMLGMQNHKAMFIVSERHKEICDTILNDLERSGTIFHAKGMYTKKEKEVLFTNVSRLEVQRIKNFICDIDPNAFITIFDAYEIIGNGFKKLEK